jgi:hypothetical protein
MENDVTLASTSGLACSVYEDEEQIGGNVKASGMITNNKNYLE